MNDHLKNKTFQDILKISHKENKGNEEIRKEGKLETSQYIFKFFQGI